MTALVITREDETRLRDLAQGIAKDIEEVETLLARLGFTLDDYRELISTRAFRQMLNEALQEWQGANNTHKRVKLKAAVNVELSLPHFYHAMNDPKEPLASKVKALEIMARIGQVGNPEPVAASSGNAFNLTIQLTGNNHREIVINSEAISRDVIEGAIPSAPAAMGQSLAFAGLPFEEI